MAITSKRTIVSYALIVAAFALADQAMAQSGQNVTLTSDQVTAGSTPYREATTAFLKKLEPKIVGGKQASKGAYPWQVSIGVSWIADPYRAHFCGGTVYSATWIVTAAHCLDRVKPKDIIVSAGTHKLGQGGSRHNANRVVVKSDYNSNTFDNDIALIELLDPLSLGNEIKSIPLLSATDESNLLKIDTTLIVLGWGATTEGGKAVRDLRFAEVPFVERENCNRPLAYDGRISENMICAGVTSGGMDSCQGDSGGPLSVNAADGPKLAGVVSWGDGCARPNRVGVYARVAKYTNWIAACVANPVTCR